MQLRACAALMAGVISMLLMATQSFALDLVRVAIPQRGSWETSPADIGQAARIFEKHGIKVETLYTSGGGETLQALIAGSVDVAIATGTSAVFGAFSKGAPIRPIASSITNAQDIYWYVPADSPIKSLKDAAAGTISFSALGSSSHLATLKLIEMNGGALKAVPTGTPPNTFTQVMSGQIDIGWSAVPFGIEALEQKRIRLIARYSDIPEYRTMTARMHVANLAFIAKTDLMKRFLAAYGDTLDWMYRGDEALEVFTKFYGSSLNEIRVTRSDFYPDKTSLDLKRLGGLDQAMADAVTLKFLPKPLTKTEMDDLFSAFIK